MVLYWILWVYWYVNPWLKTLPLFRVAAVSDWQGLWDFTFSFLLICFPTQSWTLVCRLVAPPDAHWGHCLFIPKLGEDALTRKHTSCCGAFWDFPIYCDYPLKTLTQAVFPSTPFLQLLPVCVCTQSCPTLCDPMDCVTHQAPLSMEFCR